MVKNGIQNYFEIGFHWLKNVRSTSVGRRTKHLLERVWKLFHSRSVLKILREIPKKTIFVSGESRPLQMVSESDTG